MKHFKLLLFATSLAALIGCNQVPQTDPDPRVWNNPPTERYSHTKRNGGWDFNIRKVELRDTETTVHMEVCGYSGQLYTFAQETKLKADGQSYKLISIDGITPGQYKPLSKGGHEDLVFHFEPMPATTTSFDLLESEINPRAFNVYGIHRYNPDSKKLAGTHWRNLRTGDWVISFMDSCVIYDAKIWNYITELKPESNEVQTVIIDHGGEVASIMISPLKHGKRTFRIQDPDGPKQFTCATFESKHLPEYPKVERRAYKLVDYGYDKVDTVTVSGFFIGPGRNNMSYTIDVIDPLTADNPKFAFKTDKDGYFSVKFPLANTSIGVVRGGRYGGFSMPVEPGQSYFVYDNSVSGQQFVMGKNSRVQNDFITYNQYFYADYDRLDETKLMDDTDAYLDYLIQARQTQFAVLDSLRKVHPSITDAYIDMSRAYATINLYENIGQARFPRENRPPIIPDRMMSFIKNDSKVSSFTPYSLYYDINYFLRDLTQSMTLAAQVNQGPIHISEFVEDALNDGSFTITADEKELIDWYSTTIDLVSDLAIEFQNDMGRLNDTVNKIIDNDREKMQQAANVLEVSGIGDYVNKNSNKVVMRREFNDLLCALDTMEFEESFNNIAITQYLVREITSSRHSLPAAIVAMFDSIVSDKPCQNALHQQNEKYLALENVDLASLGNDVSPEQLAGMSDGEQILRKITEPYRGKIVYIDVWGSWCHPCLENLQHAGELKESLKDYDIVYLYLASGTTDSAWKGVIKEYNLAGPNCVHYNLPANQQNLVEQFLNVSGYPTYRLLNRNGALLDVSCHPGNLPALIETLKKL